VHENPQAKLLFITNPNNPTANAAPHEDILRLIGLPLMVVVDEAYIELSAQPSVVKLVEQRDNVIVIRTLSKLAGLAGMRCGYGVFPRKIVGHAFKIKPYFTPNIAAQAAGVAVLQDQGAMQRNKRAIIAERARLCEMLDELGWVKPLPSETNFVLCEVADDGDASLPVAQRLVQYLAGRGILIRYFGGTLNRHIRISIGLPEQHDRLVAAMREFRQ
jgi:histidinol-phosphate aminotransferase